MEIEKATQDFIKELKRTDTYREYANEKERIHQFPELKSKIDEYRKRNFELQQEEESELLYDKFDALNREYEDFLENPLVNDFLSAELSLCRMLQYVTRSVTDSLDFE